MHLDVRVFDLLKLSGVLICFCMGGWTLLSARFLSRQSPTHPYPHPLGLWTSHQLADLRPPRLPPATALHCLTADWRQAPGAGLAFPTSPPFITLISHHLTSAWGPGRAWHCGRESKHQSGKRSQGWEQTEGLLNVLSLKSLHSEAGRNSPAIILSSFLP